MQWGLGIEHEVNFYRPKVKRFRGKVIQDNLMLTTRGGKPNRDETVAKSMFRPKRMYDVYDRYPAIPLYLALKYGIGTQDMTEQDFKKFFSKDREFHKYDRVAVKNMSRKTWKRIRKLIGRLRRRPGLVSQAQDFAKRATIDWSDVGMYLEFVTQDFRNATIGSTVEELVRTERFFEDTGRQAGQDFRQSRYGAYPLILVRHDRYGNSLRNKLNTNKPDKSDPKMDTFVKESPSSQSKGILTSDYNGSYHLNITLPFLESETEKQFLERHRAAMLVIQWVEPLIVSCLGQPDPYSYGDPREVFSEGSLRIMTNLHSSMATQQLDSATDALDQMTAGGILRRQPSELPTWVAPNYRKIIYSILKGYQEPARTGSDFRRAPKRKNFGFEYRITDHIPADQLQELLRLLILLSDHSYKLLQDERLPWSPKQDPQFTSVAVKVLQEGHNAKITEKELQVFSHALQIDLEPQENSRYKRRFKPKAYSACTTLKTLVDSLWKLYGNDGVYSRHIGKDALGRPFKKKPRIRNMNHEAFEFYGTFWGQGVYDS